MVARATLVDVERDPEMSLRGLPRRGFICPALVFSYAGIRGVTREQGGLVQAEADRGRAASGPLVVLFSTDLDATVASVKKAGGTIVKEPFVFPGGRRVHFEDPSGNELAAWSDT